MSQNECCKLSPERQPDVILKHVFLKENITWICLTKDYCQAGLDHWNIIKLNKNRLMFIHIQVNGYKQSYKQSSQQASCCADQVFLLSDDLRSCSLCANSSALYWPQKHPLLAVSIILHTTPKTCFDQEQLKGKVLLLLCLNFLPNFSCCDDLRSYLLNSSCF